MISRHAASRYQFTRQYQLAYRTATVRARRNIAAVADHNSPASAKLVYSSPTDDHMVVHRNVEQSPAATSCSVTARSSADGVGSPLG